MPLRASGFRVFQRRTLVRSVVSLCLAGTIALNSLAAAAPGKPRVQSTRIDEGALLLERFTFGPRPGDLDRIHAMGFHAWFEQQLEPDRIDDSALERRLDMYPAMRMSQAEQIARYPTPSMIRNAAKTGNLPADPELHAIMADQVEFYQMRRDSKVAQVAGPANGQATAAPPSLEQSTEPMPQDQLTALLSLSPQDRYQRMLRMSPMELIAARKGVKGDGSKLSDGMTPLQRETLAALAGTNRMISGELFSTRLLRDIDSNRQLEAVMTDFWLNHFNVYIRKDGNMPSLLPEYEDTVRAHALGRFEDLLAATAKSPAMLLYLDNAQSIGPDSLAAGRPRGPNVKKASAGLNENYARELMELHTLGVNGGYTQKDVTEVAKVFTGWGMERPGEGGDFLYNDRRHEPGDKQVLGHTIKASGEGEGEEVLHLLATSPATAHFLSLELAQRFVGDNPPAALVDRMAKTFLKSSGDIRSVLRSMVHAPEFFQPGTVNAKIKTPLEYVVSAVRAVHADVESALPLAQSLERLGMPLYGCQPPTGYKWDAETWLNSAALVNRMNFALLLAANKVNGTTVDTAALVADAPARVVRTLGADDGAERKEAELEAVVLPEGVSTQTRSAVLSQTDDSAVQQAMRDFGQTAQQQSSAKGKQQMVNGNVRRNFGAGPVKPNVQPADKQGAVMLGLLLGSPEFQRR